MLLLRGPTSMRQHNSRPQTSLSLKDNGPTSGAPNFSYLMNSIIFPIWELRHCLIPVFVFLQNLILVHK